MLLFIDCNFNLFKIDISILYSIATSVVFFVLLNMDFQNTREYAISQDQADLLYKFRDEFLIPRKDGKEIIYLCGNSLGLQPKSTKSYIQQQLDNWGNLGVEGWFEGETPWIFYHKELQKLMAPIVGAKPEEVIPMNNLTVNLHLMMVSFYRPKEKHYKILMEGGAFPSDQYAVESQIRFHGYDPKDAIIEIHPRSGEDTLRTEDILSEINKHADDIALILFGGINYYTGQYFDLEAITKAGHNAGAYVGFDLAHAAGNVSLKLHDWDIDFACWCTYKYMNSSPGGISGVFVHENHFNNKELNRFAGWWGYEENNRFKMTKGFVPERGAEGWQLSCSPVLMMSALKASLILFNEAGGIEKLNKKSIQLTGFLEFILADINNCIGYEQFRIITPKLSGERGCQLSIVAKDHGKLIFDELVKQHVIGDWREPDVIRISPVPFYNSFMDVFEFGRILKEICNI
jgi:kynureninase